METRAHFMDCKLQSIMKKRKVVIKSVFGSVVAGAFQIAFHDEMHANDVFLFFKNYF